MIKLFTGLPGSGKTYRAVYELNENKGKYYILHNIDGLNQEKIEDGKFIKNFSDLGEFVAVFNVENQKALSETIKEKYNRQMLIIIDECQTYLEKYNQSVKQWLAYHRHLGQDIWLITHDKFNLDRSYQSLIEVEIKGKRGFIFNSFLYAYIAQGEKIKTDRLPKKQEIFDLYQSFNVVEAEKPKSKLFWFIGLMAIIALGVGYYAFGYRYAKNLENISKANAKAAGSETKSMNAVVPVPENKLYYVGSVGKKVFLSDSSGNTWEALMVKSISDVKLFDDRSVFVVYNDGKSEIMRLQPIPADGRVEGSGRETRRPDRQEAMVQQKIIYVK